MNIKDKSPKLIIGIILLVIAVVVWLTNLTSYWIAISFSAIGLILIISRSSDTVDKETPAPVEEVVEPIETPAPVEEVVEPIETPAPAEENEEDTVLDENKEEAKE